MNTIKEYYDLLGGNNFPTETEERVNNFSKELEVKRNYSKFTTFNSNNDEMIVINGIKLFSFCEHHLLPFFGYCSIAYIPNGKILGLSKFQRLVDKISSIPTLQEDVTSSISNEVERILKPKGSGVASTCVHTCMFGRGINTSTISVNSQIVKGVLKDPIAKSEFLTRIKNENPFS